MGLLDLFKKKKTKTIFDENLDKLTSEGELPFGWHTTNLNFTETVRAEYDFFLNQYFESKKQGDPKKIYAALKSILIYIGDSKKRYAAKGECFLFWFVEICVGSGMEQKWKEEFETLEMNLDRLIEEYEIKQDIRKKAVTIIENNPGILQTDMYNYFDPHVKYFVRDVLYQLNSEGKIKREKHGRTYKLTL